MPLTTDSILRASSRCTTCGQAPALFSWGPEKECPACHKRRIDNQARALRDRVPTFPDPDRVPVVFINCRVSPFLDDIMNLSKLDETRSRNTLRALIGRRVLFAETGTRRRPLVRCSGVIGAPVVIRSREEWNRLRSRHRVPPGSRYDWQPDTKVKYLYPITGVLACYPFTPPEGVRHGRVWMEIREEAQQ